MRACINNSFVWLILLLLTSCQRNTLYHSYQPVNSMGWHKNDTMIYSLNSPIASQNLMLEIGLRHTDAYPYRDLWLNVNQDTVHIYLTDSVGHWKGKGIGELRSLIQTVSFSHQKDSIKDIRITHIMTDKTLIGIHDIGIRIAKM